MNRNELTQKELKKVLKYDPDSGIFIWKVAGNHFIKVGDIAGHAEKDGYIKIRLNYNMYKAHRLAWLYIKGYFPEHQIDHMDRNKSNNKWKNLRHVSASCNSRNKKIQSNNKSGVTGVCWSKKAKGWTAQIVIHRKQIYIGSFKNLDDAVKARWEAEVKYNFPNCNSSSAAYLYLKNNGLIK